MPFTIQIRHLNNPTTERKLDLILKTLIKLVEDIATMTTDFSPIREAITANTNIIQSIVDLLNDVALRAEFDAHDASAIRGLAAEIRAQGEALAAAVVKNTPADLNTVPEPFSTPASDSSEAVDPTPEPITSDNR
jgi:hypothetical protein